MSTKPLGAQNELIFALRCTVYEIEAILIRHMYDLERSYDLICPYMSTNPLGTQNELIFALRCTVYKIEAILIRRMCDLKMTLKGYMTEFVHMCLLIPWGPKLSLFLLYDAPFTR